MCLLKCLRNKTQLQNSHQNYRSSTPKHQRQVIQVQSNGEIQADLFGIENTEKSELQLNHNNCELTDDEMETQNALSIKKPSMKMNTKYQLIRLINKTLKIFIDSKNQTIHKT